MKKIFFILSLMISLCIIVSCANGSSSTSKEEEKERDYSCSVRIVNMIAQENDDFYETEKCSLRFYEGIKKIKAIIRVQIFDNTQDENGKMINWFITKPELLEGFYVKDVYGASNPVLTKNTDGTYSFEIDTEQLTNGSTRKYEYRFKVKGEEYNQSDTFNVKIYSKEKLKLADIEDYTTFGKTRKKFISTQKRFEDKSFQSSKYPVQSIINTDGDIIIPVCYRGININNIKAEYDYSNDCSVTVLDTPVWDSENLLYKVNIKIEHGTNNFNEFLEYDGHFGTNNMELQCDEYKDSFEITKE